LKKSPTGPAFTKGSLKNKSRITSNNKGFTFIADNSMNRLVCLRWISKAQRKENFSREERTALAPTKKIRKMPPMHLYELRPRKDHRGVDFNFRCAGVRSRPLRRIALELPIIAG